MNHYDDATSTMGYWTTTLSICLVWGQFAVTSKVTQANLNIRETFAQKILQIKLYTKEAFISYY